MVFVVMSVISVLYPSGLISICGIFIVRQDGSEVDYASSARAFLFCRPCMCLGSPQLFGLLHRELTNTGYPRM